MITSVSSNANDGTSSNSSRSGSPIEQYISAIYCLYSKILIFFIYYRLTIPETSQSGKSKVRQRTAAPAELLFGLKTDSDYMTKSHDSNMLRIESNNSIQRVPSVPGSLKLVVLFHDVINIVHPILRVFKNNEIKRNLFDLLFGMKHNLKHICC